MPQTVRNTSLDQRSYGYKTDCVLRMPTNLIMNIGQNDLVDQRFELALLVFAVASFECIPQVRDYY
jgi:hypothetical protein